MNKTSEQYDHVIGICRVIFEKKMKDYGIAWRILRPSSMTDQIYIKAQRIRSIEEKGIQQVDAIFVQNSLGLSIIVQWPLFNLSLAHRTMKTSLSM